MRGKIFIENEYFDDFICLEGQELQFRQERIFGKTSTILNDNKFNELINKHIIGANDLYLEVEGKKYKTFIKGPNLPKKYSSDIVILELSFNPTKNFTIRG